MIEPEDISFSSIQSASSFSRAEPFNLQNATSAVANIKDIQDAGQLLEQTFLQIFQAANQLKHRQSNELIEEKFIRKCVSALSIQSSAYGSFVGVTRNVIRTRLIKYGLL